MRHFRHTCTLDEGVHVGVWYCWEAPEGGVDQLPLADQDAYPAGKGTSSSSTVNKEGEDPSLQTFKSLYRNLPSTLKSCLDYCAAVGPNTKGILVRLILAEGLIPQRDGEIIEDTAANVISELLSLGMLQEDAYYGYPSYMIVPFYEELFVHQAGKEDLVAEAAKSFVRKHLHTPNYLCEVDDRDHSPQSFDFEGLLVHSLFNYGFSSGLWPHVRRLEFLVVLYLCWQGEKTYLPEEVGDLVHLKYLGLTLLNELPRTLGKLQKLQTLQIEECCNEIKLPIEVFEIQNLRHLIKYTWYDDGAFILPKGIGRLVNLHTCIGVNVGRGIATELNDLTSLRELGVVDVSDDHVIELLESIMKMENLLSLSLRADVTCFQHISIMVFPPLEPFRPPPFVQELHLEGGLFEMPSWLGTMENLTRLSLFSSNLPESPTLVLQFLPRLKFLHLCEAYNARLIGKEFCAFEGFPVLETLCIRSKLLVGWTEIIHGAFSHLKRLEFHHCGNLRSLPDNLQNISTLKTLFFLGDVNQDLIRRLKGEENYKVKHILEFLIHEFLDERKRRVC